MATKPQIEKNPLQKCVQFALHIVLRAKQPGASRVRGEGHVHSKLEGRMGYAVRTWCEYKKIV